MYTENISDTWHIPRYPTQKHCITGIYIQRLHQTLAASTSNIHRYETTPVSMNCLYPHCENINLISKDKFSMYIFQKLSKQL